MEKDSNEKKAPAYLTKISSETFDKLKEQLLQLMVVEKKYRDRHFTANVSIVLNVRYHLNYSQFVNRLRIEEAMALLADKRYAGLRMDEISDMVGFANRQSFYRAFQLSTGVTPRQYQANYIQP